MDDRSGEVRKLSLDELKRGFDGNERSWGSGNGRNTGKGNGRLRRQTSRSDNIGVAVVPRHFRSGFGKLGSEFIDTVRFDDGCSAG